MPDRIFRRPKPSGPGQDPSPDDPFAVADAADPDDDGYPTTVYTLGRAAEPGSGPRSARALR